MYDEWLPNILGIDIQKYEGYNPEVDATINVEFSTIAGRSYSNLDSCIQINPLL